MRRLVWTALVMTVSATVAGLTVRALDRLWRAVTQEPPPEMPRWARLVAGRFLHRPIARLLHPSAV